MASPPTKGWWSLVNRGTGEQLEDLEAILNEPEPTPAASRATAAAAAAEPGDVLPVSSNSPFPRLAESPDKLGRLAAAGPPPTTTTAAAAAAAAAAAGQPTGTSAWASYLPSVTAWLPSTAARPGVQQQEQQAAAVSREQGASWRSHAPGLGEGSSAAALASPPGHAAAPGANDVPQPGSRHDDSSQALAAGTALTAWALQAQQQLSAACHATAQQLAAAGTTAVGVSVLGAAVGGVLAGPLGMAAGAKSGAAIVAAGAVGGAAVKQLALGGIHPAALVPAAGGRQEREMQPLSPAAKAARQAQETGE